MVIRSLYRRALQLAYIAYYRLLYGRQFPFANWLEDRVRQREQGREDVPISQEMWNDAYRSGRWEVLRGVDELPHHSVIAGYLHHFHPAGSVLDVGCGEGVLLDYLRPFGVSRYLGIDLAEEAIRQGEHRVDDRVEFLVSDAEAYQPTERWDAIVFNESVYFFDAPVDTVLRYRDALTGGGTLIVSTYRHATFRFRSWRGESIAKKLVERLPLFEEVAVTTSRGTWLIQVFRPR